MAGSKRDFKEVGDLSLHTDKMNQWIKDGVDLVCLIDQGHIQDVDDVKKYLDCSGASADIDKINSEGQTPLMIACRNGQTAIVNFLLEAGANPNLTCTKICNSALHYVCQGKQDVVLGCTEEPNYPKEKLQEVIKIVEILASHGALPGVNAYGLSPVCLAALNSYRDVVEFFASRSVITTPIADKVKAYELLGVSQAIFGKHHLIDACEAFHLASIYSKDIEDTPHHFISDLGAWFHDMMNKKNLSRNEKVQVKAKALLIGLQCLPDKIKNKYKFTDTYHQCAQVMISSRDLEEGYSLLAALANKDIQNENWVICVLEMLKCTARQLRASSENLHFIPKLLNRCAETLRKGDFQPSRINCESMLDLLGGLLFNLAYYHSELEYLEPSIPYVGTIVKTINKTFDVKSSQYAEQGPLSTSIHIAFFESMGESMWEDMYSGQSKKTRNMVEFAIRRMLYVCGFDPDFDNFVLQTLLEVIPVAYDMEFIVSVCRVLIQFGCQTDDACVEDDDKEKDGIGELLELLTPPTTPISLEELTSRTILSNTIPYRDRLPVVLCEKIEGDLLKFDPYKLESPSDSDSD